MQPHRLKEKREVFPGTRLASLASLNIVGVILALRPMFDASQSLSLTYTYTLSKVRYLESTASIPQYVLRSATVVSRGLHRLTVTNQQSWKHLHSQCPSKLTE